MTLAEHVTVVPTHCRGLYIPEVLRIICCFSCISDSARLSRTCKSLFSVPAAFVWTTVDGAHNLLYLLGASCQTAVIRSEPPQYKHVTIKIPASSPIDLSRLSLYAPFVHKVFIDGKRSNFEYEVYGWEYLISRTQSSPLLPNLSTIVFGSFVAENVSPLWIKLFASPSLTGILGANDDTGSPSIPDSMVDVTLDILAQNCSHLLRLWMFITSKRPRFVASNLLGSSEHPPSYRALGDLTHLVELVCDDEILEPAAFLVISTLPKLQKLEIRVCSNYPDSELDSLPPDSFPALQDLTLLNVSPHETSIVFKFPSVLKRLTRIKLQVDLMYFELDVVGDQSEGEHVASQILAVFKNSPALSYLDVDIQILGEYEDSDVGFPVLADTFSMLPLNTVILSGLHVASWARDMTTLNSVWSNVTDLRLQDQDTLLGDLRYFAQLTRLQVLLICVTFERVQEPDETLPLCALRTLVCVRNQLEHDELEHVEAAGGILLWMFPVLQKVEWVKEYNLEEPDSQQSFDILNRNIEFRRGDRRGSENAC